MVNTSKIHCLASQQQMVAVAYFIWTNTAIEILDQAVDGLSYMIDIVGTLYSRMQNKALAIAFYFDLKQWLHTRCLSTGSRPVQ